jgi:zona occludens toxin (predicted ATPase)
MRIPLKPGWEDYRFNTKIYPASPGDRRVIDDTFDHLHDQDKMHWSCCYTPFGALVFVVWKIVIDEKGNLVRKG